MEPTGDAGEPSGAPVSDVGWVDTGDGTMPEGMTFLASDADTYEFSTEPQDAAERWIFDNYPELWEDGVRAVTPSNMWNPGAISSHSSDKVGGLVQYINGERFEGSAQLPLAFDYAEGNPHVVSSAVRQVLVEAADGDRSTGDPTADRGDAAYRVEIREKGSWTEVHFVARGLGSGAVYLDRNGPREHGSWEEAWASIQENGFVPNIEGARALYPGEIASVSVHALTGGQAAESDFLVFNPATGDFDKVFDAKAAYN